MRDELYPRLPAVRRCGLTLTACAALAVLACFSIAQTPMESRKGKDKGGAKTMPVGVRLEIKSPAFSNNAYIPKKHTCEGEDVSPQIIWSGLPPSAKSLVLIMDDPDAPPGTWVHWVLYDLPAGLKELTEGLPKKETLPGGAKHGLCWGVDQFDRVGYYGPCPPPGKPHRYFFKLYALDGTLGLGPKATKAQVLKAMEGHILAQGELIGLYKR